VKIGIIQIVEHPALDAAREGFLDALKENGYEVDKNLDLQYQSAQGDQTLLNSIANQYASSDLDLILAIATPSAQAMAAQTEDIPILVTAVTDLVVAGLVESNENPGTNVSGTSDMNPVKDQLELLKKLFPDVKTVGIIYNAAEINSEIQVNVAKEAAPELGLEIVEKSVATSADVLQAAQSLVGSVEAIYVPTDNMVVSAAQSVVQVANENKIPLIAGESSVVEKGGLATVGIIYYDLGKQTGEMAIRVLEGEDISQMPVERQERFDTIINKDTVELLGITIPEDLANEATIKSFDE
ncbi:MAG: ABC transporter substrate-binding protein, partial [Desulfitobacterium sp.]|nr:ABC transporter substrate-binding protein [Desulfitobacterium sp.]